MSYYNYWCHKLARLSMWLMGIIFFSGLALYIVLNFVVPREKFVNCPHKHFFISGMDSCHPWLGCSDLKDIDVKEIIGVGGVKVVYRAVWKSLNVTVSKLNNVDYIDDFNHGIKMLQLLNPSAYVIQLVGFCDEEHIVLTQYHKNGDAVNISNLLERYSEGNMLFRLKLCLNYALLLEYLHNGPGGCRVMCDSNTLRKTLSQLLVTDDLTLILNDVDALPEVGPDKNITCGSRELSGDFIAPEQTGSSNVYNEKTDIWKAASVCDHFLGDDVNSDVVRYKLFFLHKKCKSINAADRPTATQLAAQYIKIMHELDGEL